MIQQFIIPFLAALLASSVVLAAFYFREYRLLKRQVQALVADSAKEAPERLDNGEKRCHVPDDASAAPVNSNRRSQVLRLHRSGESVSSIASALGISQGEVKLMVKVQELIAETGA